MQAEDFTVKHHTRFDRLVKMTISDRETWISHELIFWRGIRDELSLQKQKSVYLEKIDTYIDILKSGGKNISTITKFENFQNLTPFPFHDENPEKLVFPDLAASGQFDAAVYSFQASLRNFSKAYIKTYDEDLKEIEEKFKTYTTTKIDDFKKEISELTNKLNESLEKAENATLKNLTLELNNSKAEIKNTLTAANKAILSAEPVQYWEERERKHKEKAKAYKKFLIYTAIFFILLLAYLTISVYKDQNVYTIAGIQITLPAEKVSIALLIIVTTGAIWLTRVLVKLMMTNLALEIEALERSTMIKTYIAMDNAKGEQAQEIRMLFYSTLFKPSNNNLTDDSTSPEYIRIIEAMLQKKNNDKT